MEIEIRYKQKFDGSGGGGCSIKQNSTIIQVPDLEEKLIITIDPNVSFVCNKCKGQTFRQYGGYGVGAGQLY